MATKKPKIQPRKPPKANREQLAAFVAGAPAESTRGVTTVYTRRTGDQAGQQLRRVTLYLPTDLFRRAKVAAAEKDVPLSDLVAKALEDNLLS